MFWRMMDEDSHNLGSSAVYEMRAPKTIKVFVAQAPSTSPLPSRTKRLHQSSWPPSKIKLNITQTSRTTSRSQKSKLRDDPYRVPRTSATTATTPAKISCSYAAGTRSPNQPFGRGCRVETMSVDMVLVAMPLAIGERHIATVMSEQKSKTTIHFRDQHRHVATTSTTTTLFRAETCTTWDVHLCSC